MNKSEQLIACLEGEIAKRDARIVELEQQVIGMRLDVITQVDAHAVTRAELSAIKAQEPVAWAGAIEYGVPLLMVEPQNWKATPLYAAPVSEAKAQGVVQWPNADEIMQMAFEEGQPADDASGYCFELEEFDLFIERLMSEVARLNAAPVSSGDPEKCSYQDDPRSPAELSLAGCNCVRFGECNPHWPCKLHTPAADAGLVEALDYQALFDAIAAATSVYANGAINISVQAFRDALSAHRAKGVV